MYLVLLPGRRWARTRIAADRLTARILEKVMVPRDGAVTSPSAVSSRQRFTTRIIDNEGALPTQPEWNALLTASRANNLFLTWEWIHCWKESIGQPLRLLVVTVRDERDSLVGLAPFYVTVYRLARLVPFRILRVLGDLDSGAEYLDWIVRKDCEHEAAEAIATALARTAGWDCLFIPKVAGWTGARERIRDAAAAGGFWVQERERTFSSVPLPSDYEAFMDLLGAQSRSSLRRQTRRILGARDLSFETCRSEVDLGAYLEALFDLHERRWRAMGQPGIFSRWPATVQFYSRFTRMAWERGWLRFFAVREGPAFKAVQIGYVYDGVFHQLQEGFDPASLAGIGNVLRGKAIEASIQEGVRAYDFLGGFGEHKRRWGARPRIGYDLLLGRRSLRTLPLFAAGFWPTGRYLRPVDGGTSSSQ